VIVRSWRARAAKALAPAYAEHLRAHVVPALARLDGFERVLLLEREDRDGIEIVVETFWRSLDDVRAFAGADIERAVVADEAAALLLDFDRRVRHYEVRLDRQG
jgi:heme-degrading monooxygenase HmoA